jgi:ABC-2 type transport system permease protein
MLEAITSPGAAGQATSSPEVITPSAGGPLAVALSDLKDALGRYPLWLHQGWVDVVQKYRRTRIGPLWHTISLGIFIGSMGTIYAVILRIDPVTYFRNVTVNLIIWTLISNAIVEGTGHFVAGQATALSMRFSYFAFTFALAWRGLLMFGHHFILYLLVASGTHLVPTPAIALAVPALALVLFNNIWLALLAGIACLRFRDLGPAIASGVQVLMFVTPIFWPADLLGQKLAFLAEFNPFYHLLIILRDPLLGHVPAAGSWLWAAGFAAAGWIVTLWIYGRYRDRFAYWY